MLLNKNIPLKYIFKKVKYDVTFILLIGSAINLITREFHSLLPEIPIAIPTFLGTAISVLLSFKMNQSYDRWWEARKIWGSIVNDSRSFVVLLQSLISDETDKVKIIAYRQIAWCYSLGKSLRGLDAIEDAGNFVSDKDLLAISKHNNKPLALLQQNSQDIKNLKSLGKIESLGVMQLNETLVRLCDAMGKAERIKGTIFPSTYRKFLHYIIYLFVFTLSVALKDMNMIFVMLLLLLIPTAFFLIEKSAFHLQDPFENRPSDVSVTAIARTIEINIRQLLGEESIPEPAKPTDFYIM